MTLASLDEYHALAPDVAAGTLDGSRLVVSRGHAGEGRRYALRRWGNTMRPNSNRMANAILFVNRFVTIGILLFAFAGPAHAKKLLQNVPLVWRPTTQIGSGGPVIEVHREATVDPRSGASSSDTTGRLDVGGARIQDMGSSGPARVQIARLTDARKNPQVIGENRENADAGKILPVTTKDDVAAWCTDRLRILLEQLGLDVVESDGDVILGGQVRRFFVAETNTYEGDVGLKIEVKAKDGRLLWSGLANGVANRFGRSYKLENYYEVISDSLLDAVQKLVAHDNFIRALGGKRAPGSDE